MPNKAITLEALQIIDAIDRRGSFAQAADELDKATSSLSYQVQKLENDLDIMIFDRSGHKASLTEAGKFLVSRGRVILEATDDMVKEARMIANGWELDLVIAYDTIIPVSHFFGLVDKLGEQSPTRIKLQEEVLAGGWECLMEDRCELLVCPEPKLVPQGIVTQVIGELAMVWVASSDHSIHRRQNQAFDTATRAKHRIIAIADTAQRQPSMSINILEKQPRLTVSSLNSKIEALIQGLGIGTLPLKAVQPLLDSGQLKVIEGSETSHSHLVLAWKRSNIGSAKSWCIKYLTQNRLS